MAYDHSKNIHSGVKHCDSIYVLALVYLKGDLFADLLSQYACVFPAIIVLLPWI